MPTPTDQPNSSSSPATSPAKRSFFKSTLGKVLIGGTLVVVGLLILAVALLPTIASSIAPGIIEKAAAGSIKGTVKVSGVSLSYSGPSKVDRIELFDPAGKSVAVVSVNSSVGILGLLSGIGDLGTIDISGGATINATEQKDGTTLVNLIQAIESRPSTSPSTPSTPKSPSSGPSIPPKLAATINFKPLNIIYTATDTAGVSTRSSLKNATGVIRVAGSGPKGATLSIEFDSVTDAAGTPGSIKLRSLVEQLAGPDGALTPDKATTQTTLEITGLPMAIVDGLTKQGTLLQSAIGPTMAATVNIDGNMSAAKATVQAKGSNLDLAGSASISTSKVSLASPLTIKLASTTFINTLPSLKASLTQAGITLDQAPAVTLTIKSLDLPLAGSAGPDLKNLTLDAELTTTSAGGTLALANATGTDTTKPSTFALTPLRLTIAAAPLGTSLKVTTATSATIDGQPAGELAVDIDAKGLISAGNKFALGTNGLPSDLTAKVELKNASTSLLQPFTKPTGLDLDLRTDLGPTLDLTITAGPDTTTPSAPDASKPLRIDANVRSANVNITAPLTLSSTALTGRGDITITAQSLTPLLRRLTASKTPGQTTTIDGKSALNLTLADFVYPLAPAATNNTGTAAAQSQLRARAAVTLTDIRAALTRDTTTVPLTITELRAATTITGQPGATPTIDLSGRFASTDRQAKPMPFALTGQLSMPKPAGSAAIAALGTSRVVGKLALTEVPTALIERLASLDLKTADLAAALLGRSAGVTIDLVGTPADQSVNATLTSAGSVAGAVNATLTATALQLSKAEVRASVDQPLVDRIMQLSGSSPQDLAGASLSAPTALVASIKPVSIPLAKDAKGGPTLSPDFTSGGTLEASVTLGDVAVKNLKVGESTINGGLKGVLATAKLPLSALGTPKPGAPANPTDIQATLSATLQRDTKTIATLAGNLTASADFAMLDGSINLTDLIATEVDAVLGKPGYISGAVGPKATIAATAKRAGPTSPLTIKANVTSDRLTVDGLAFTQTDDRIDLSVAKPITWNLNKDWANANLFTKPAAPTTPGAPSAPGTQLAADAVATITITKLTLAKATTGKTPAESTGMFTPGVFAANLKLAIPTAALSLPGQGTQRDAVTASNVAVEITTATDQQLTLDIKIPTLAVTSHSLTDAAPTPASKPGAKPTPAPTTSQPTEKTDNISNVAIRGTVQNLADARGNLQINRAKFGLTSATPALPSSVLSLFVSETPDNLARLLGNKLNLDVVIKAVTLGAATPSSTTPSTTPTPAAEPGSVAAKLQSNLTAVRIEGPVQNGTLIISKDKPLVMKLAQFTVLEGSAPAKALPLFATIRKTQTPLAPGKTRPELLSFDLPPVIAASPPVPPMGKPVMTPEPLDEAIIYSRDLHIPIDGDLTKLTGQLTVDMGKVEFTYASFLSKLVKENATEWGVDATGTSKAPRMKPFTVTFDRGIARYVGIEIPLSAQFSTGINPTIKAEGTADLVAKQLNLSVEIPMSVASELLFGEAMGALRAVNGIAAGGLDKILSTVNKAGSGAVGAITDEIIVPLRITGPFDAPKTSIDSDKFGQRMIEILPRLLAKAGLGGVGGAAGDAIKGIGDLIDGLGKKKPK